MCTHISIHTDIKRREHLQDPNSLMPSVIHNFINNKKKQQ